MLDFLPPRLAGAVRYVNRNFLYELRVRADKPLAANVGGRYLFLGEQGEAGMAGALRPTREEVADALFAASGYSVYSVEEELRRGFVTTKDGERIGVAGTVVSGASSVLAVRDVTSLCIRIPHEILGCAEEIFLRCLGGGLCSLAVLAPPGEGKTTILRDLCRLVSERMHANILVADERGELSAGNLGETADVVKYSDKLTAFTAGIRAMRPDVIVTDELLPEDYRAVRRALEGGVKVFASAHLVRFEDVPEKIFDRYIFLSGLGRVGRIAREDGSDVD